MSNGDGALDGFMAINPKVYTMDRSIKNKNQTIHAIQVGCDNYSGSHLTKDCDLDENDNKKAQVSCSRGDRFGEDSKELTQYWKPYDEYKKT